MKLKTMDNRVSHVWIKDNERHERSFKNLYEFFEFYGFPTKHVTLRGIHPAWHSYFRVGGEMVSVRFLKNWAYANIAPVHAPRRKLNKWSLHYLRLKETHQLELDEL